MRKNVLPGMLLTLLVGCSSRTSVADLEDPKSVVERAIKAQGGEENLAQFKAGRWKGRGTLILGGRELSATLETVYQLPDKYKSVMQFKLDGKSSEVIQVLEGDKGWMSGEGKTLNLEGDLLKSMKEEFHSASVELLVPLLKEKGYTLSPLKEITVNGKPAVGVKVAAKDHKDIELYFDKESALPVRTVRAAIDPLTLKEANFEVLYSEIKDFDGIKAPTKMVVNQDGKKLIDLEVIEFKKQDKFDPNEFNKPN